MNSITRLVLIVSFGFVVSGCEPSPSESASISLERWSVTGTIESKQKDEIQYLETVQYGESGEETARLFYDQNKKLAAKEIRVFKEGTIVPKGSQYKDAKDSLLSYYVFELDSYDRVAKANAFDASSDELLRIEKFKYDKKDNIVEKTICSSDDLPVRIMRYSFDKNGNEQQVQVLQGDGTVVLTEVFDITKYNDQGMWTEKWGFVNDDPFSFVSRRIEY